MPTAGRAPPPAPAQSSHSQGSENSAMPVRRGRRKREPFQEKGGQPAPATCHQGLRAEGAGGGWLCMLAPASPGNCPSSPPGALQSPGAAAPLAANHQVYTDAAMGKRPQPRIAVSEDIQCKEGRNASSTPPAAVHRAPQLPSHQQWEAHILNSSAHLSSLSYCVCYSTKQSSSPLHI